MWIFTASIFGSVICAAVVFFISHKLSLIFPKFPDPTILTLVTFIVTLFTLSSIPRYQFEKSTLADISRKPWIRVINQTQWGDVTEPLTWISTPIGSFLFATPNPENIGGYRELSMRYKETPHIYNVRPSCENRIIQRSEIDKDGKFSPLAEDSTKMVEFEINAYCLYDWKKERDAIKSSAL